MQYLMIENHGECPIEGYTILGLSSSRGNSSAIGQFGSGNKHAVLCLMREGIYPIICSGRNTISYSIKPAKMGDTSYNKVLFQIGNGRKQELGFCLEYGELDWFSIDMALREFISNAIDADPELWHWELVDKPRAKSGMTRVYIPATPDVLAYAAKMKDKFLHIRGQQNLKLIPKKTKEPANIYRKGVFVRQLASHRGYSLFDYNFGDELYIDEARNLDDYACLSPAANLVMNSVDAMRDVLLSFQNQDRVWEWQFNSYSITAGNKDKLPELKQTFERMFGDKAVVCATNIEVDVVQRKGYIGILVESSGWFKALCEADVKSSMEILCKTERKGRETKVDKTVEAKAAKVWSWIQDVNLTRGKDMPPVLLYSEPMDGGSVLGGYYEDGKVYINSYCKDDYKVFLEEFAHHITEATDNSRDFQDYAFLLATEMARLIYD